MIGVISLQLRLYEVKSLKDKRSIIKSVVEKTRSKFKISIAEIDDQDILDRAYIEIALVSNSKSRIEQCAQKILKFILLNERVDIISQDVDLL